MSIVMLAACAEIKMLGVTRHATSCSAVLGMCKCHAKLFAPALSILWYLALAATGMRYIQVAKHMQALTCSLQSRQLIFLPLPQHLRKSKRQEPHALGRWRQAPSSAQIVRSCGACAVQGLNRLRENSLFGAAAAPIWNAACSRIAALEDASQEAGCHQRQS
jgi:hypothetical protein